MTIITREQLSELLHTGECMVEFTKVNGEVRSMPCSLTAELIPPAPVKVLEEGEVPKVKKENPEVMSVWCLEYMGRERDSLAIAAFGDIDEVAAIVVVVDVTIDAAAHVAIKVMMVCRC